TERKTVVGFTKPFDNNINNIVQGEEKTQTFNDVLYVSDVSNVDREFEVVVLPLIVEESDPPFVETNPENYSFEPTVIIPANTQKGSITITGIGNSIVDERGEYFTLGIKGEGDIVSGGRFTVRLKLRN